jgi:hypothetical protein
VADIDFEVISANENSKTIPKNQGFGRKNQLETEK